MRGSAQDKAFEVVRSGHSPTFLLFDRAILNRQQVTCLYKVGTAKFVRTFSGTMATRRRHLSIRLAERVKAA